MSGTLRGVPSGSRDHLGVLPGFLRMLAQGRHRGRRRCECRRGVHTPRVGLAPRADPLRRRGADRQLHIERSTVAAGIFIRRHKCLRPAASPALRRTLSRSRWDAAEVASLFKATPRMAACQGELRAAPRALAAPAENRVGAGVRSASKTSDALFVARRRLVGRPPVVFHSNLGCYRSGEGGYQRGDSTGGAPIDGRRSGGVVPHEKQARPRVHAGTSLCRVDVFSTAFNYMRRRNSRGKEAKDRTGQGRRPAAAHAPLPRSTAARRSSRASRAPGA